MFNNIGDKIKTVAVIISILGIIFSVILGLVFLTTSTLIGILIILLGSLLSWVSTFLLFGFGQLIENSDIICQHLLKSDPPSLPNLPSTGDPIEDSVNQWKAYQKSKH